MLTVARHVVWQDVPGELVLFDERANAYRCLDRVGSEIWRLVAGGASLDDAIADLQGRYDAAPDRIAAETTAFVRDAVAERLLVDAEPGG